jgi:hypothetical protein
MDRVYCHVKYMCEMLMSKIGARLMSCDSQQRVTIGAEKADNSKVIFSSQATTG